MIGPLECSWCAVRRSWFSRLRCRAGLCSRCHEKACCEAGIYLQSGGPPFLFGSRRGVSE
jgi:hypothetical protein